MSEIVAAARDGRLPDLSPEQKRVWYLFFLMQWRRTPETERSVASDAELSTMLDEALAELGTLVPDRKADIEALSTTEAKARIMRNVRVDNLQSN